MAGETETLGMWGTKGRPGREVALGRKTKGAGAEGGSLNWMGKQEATGRGVEEGTSGGSVLAGLFKSGVGIRTASDTDESATGVGKMEAAKGH